MTTDTPTKTYILGVPVSVVNMSSAVSYLTNWANECGTIRKVFLRDVHGLMRAVDSKTLRELHEEADMVMPDGAPLTWIGRFRGLGSAIGRTPGADVVEEVCRASVLHGHSHFFFGGKPGIAERMAEALKDRHPGLRIAGIISPPMREYGVETPLSDQEVAEIEVINNSGADYIWIGISTPKQEIWMTRAEPLLNRGVMFGVGAAFDFHAGVVRRAPAWMRRNGLEWFHRLLSEPRRLWRRYLVLAPRFVILVMLSAVSNRFRTLP